MPLFNHCTKQLTGSEYLTTCWTDLFSCVLLLNVLPETFNTSQSRNPHWWNQTASLSEMHVPACLLNYFPALNLGLCLHCLLLHSLWSINHSSKVKWSQLSQSKRSKLIKPSMAVKSVKVSFVLENKQSWSSQSCVKSVHMILVWSNSFWCGLYLSAAVWTLFKPLIF